MESKLRNAHEIDLIVLMNWSYYVREQAIGNQWIRHI